MLDKRKASEERAEKWKQRKTEKENKTRQNTERAAGLDKLKAALDEEGLELSSGPGGAIPQKRLFPYLVYSTQSID